MEIREKEVKSDQFSIKYRPQTLEDIVGQTRVVRDCRNILQNKKNISSFLLSGKTGTGKTTLARILANSLNPDGLDVYEYNVSDKRKIEDVREIIDKLQYRPLSNEKHVFILDEVHQMQKQSASALLKLLEDPSNNAVWILCTDQPSLLLQTIRDRCYLLTLEEIKKDSLVGLLKRVKTKELKLISEELNLKIKTEEDKKFLGDSVLEAMNNIAEISEGCPRRCLQTFQQYMLSLREILVSYMNEEEVDKEFLKGCLISLKEQLLISNESSNTQTITAFCTNLAGNFVLFRCLQEVDPCKEDTSVNYLNAYTSTCLSISVENIHGITRFVPKALEALLSILSGKKEVLDSSEFLAKSVQKFILNAIQSAKGKAFSEVLLQKHICFLYKTLHKLQLDISLPSFDISEYSRVVLLNAIHNQ